MIRLLPLLLLCACAGSLVDHNDPALTSNVTCDPGKFKSASDCRDASSLSGGASHTCAVVAGTVRCWGANDQGQLGRPGASSFVPVQAAVAGAATAIAAGSSHACAIADGTVWCWGDNTFGQLGLGTVGASSATPQVVPNFSGVSQLAAGASHTCAASAIEMRCWGRNNLGQLGNAASLPDTSRPEPTQVVGVGSPVAAIAAGDSHTCAIGTSGVYCWGNNGAGQLGINQSGGAYSTPTLISSSSLNGAVFLGLGANHSCAGTFSATLFCWGANGVYQVDTSGQDQKSPRQSVVAARVVAGGTGHTCAIGNDQTPQCWGLDDKGQLGVASSDYGPFDVDLHGVTAIAAGNKHTCAVANGATLCWGLNDRGQLGVDPTATPSTPTPTAIFSH
jgi:alpha-tubulin suppressor-like RCC1 family protein